MPAQDIHIPTTREPVFIQEACGHLEQQGYVSSTSRLKDGREIQLVYKITPKGKTLVERLQALGLDMDMHKSE